MTRLSCLLIGHESLLVQCAETLIERGHSVAAVVTAAPDIAGWAEARGIPVEVPGADLGTRLGTRLGSGDVDWLFSIANLSVIPEAVLTLARRGAVNFHDGPLPDYAGLNAPVWAILNGEAEHGVSWHLMEGGVDEGDLLVTRRFPVAEDETALTLNAKCFAAAIDSFGDLIEGIEAGGPARQPQDLSKRRYFGRDARPPAAGRLDFRRDAADLVALVRALDHGGYRNPLLCPKIVAEGRVVLVGSAEPAERRGAAAEPGRVLEVEAEGLTVATGDGAVTLGGLRDAAGRAVEPSKLASVGIVLPSPDVAEAERLTAAAAAAAKDEPRWRARLAALVPADLGLPPAGDAGAGALLEMPVDLSAGRAAPAALAAALAARLSGAFEIDLAFRDGALAEAAAAAPGLHLGWKPVRFPAGQGDEPLAAAAERFAAALSDAACRAPVAADLPAREPALSGLATPDLGLSFDAGPVPGAAVTLVVSGSGAQLVADPARVTEAALGRLAARLATLAAAPPETPVAALPVLSGAERAELLDGRNDTAAEYTRDATMHGLIAAQAAATPGAVALVCKGESLTYAQLEARANRVAHRLRAMGVGRETVVGLHLGRGLDLVVGAIAIQKAGGAYLPLDPTYPADRIRLYVEDSGTPVIVTDRAHRASLPESGAAVLEIDADPHIAAQPDTAPEEAAGPGSLAYLIYTSGSTGRPKGVMIEHRTVANFYAGMDERVGTAKAPGTWLAVTSLSFDISVLELFYTLARGYRVVILADEARGLVSDGRLSLTGRGMDFSLFYWGNDDGVGPKKYELLLEGAKFADAHGFCAVWTPERHFHAFGGPYPNPSVTGAAVAAVTSRIGVRAGSCVAPLHHPARIAEEWAVIDNLTNGRAGLAIASGWQPDDFVLRPENTPPANKTAMFEAIETLRRLWRGEAVEFPTQSGKPHAVVTQPRPVSTDIDLWVTTAGNPETWKEAGRIGAHVLTHLLGQSIEEVAGKIALYREARAGAGYDPDTGKVTLMLHTYLGADRETVRETARGPMKDYLRSAAGLIKQYAWAFPAFKKPKGVTNPFEIDLGSLDGEEMEAILDFAFQRYFEDSGLFGTVEDAAARVEALKRIGVDEIACLIDYGIPVAQVMEGLRPLADVVARANAPEEVPEDDRSIAAEIVRHRVTHLQCTPSMARMIAMNPEARAALGRVKRLMVGGEALPGALAADLASVVGGPVENMYGPTETTIWSSTERVGPDAAAETVVNIGRPIANTRLYVLDARGEPVPVGVAGELWIGGEGVARGYLNRPELTAERFVPDPFAGGEARMYRTGDLVRWREDGKLDFLGRADHQVKIRGYRIELGEIEARLAALPGVQEAVVLAREDTPGDMRLVAYVAPAARAPSAETARARLAESLPEHMVPSHLVALETLPLTPNGKIDRKALPAPSEVRAAARPAPEPAAAEGAAGQIAAIWSKVLGVERIGLRDNFFELGGHSLLAVQAHREIRQALGASALSITDIFRYPTLGALAEHVEGPKRAEPRPAETGTAAAERGQARADAMARRRALRARRQTEPG